MTKQLNYQDQYLQNIEASITDIEQAGKIWEVQLDRTIFYPEGGGQPGDRGEIGGQRVVDTRKRDGKILHLLDKKPEFSTGEQVSCRLDWVYRYDFMQQHTGQHIISGVLYSAYGIGTVSVHQGDDYLTVETDRGSISEEEITIVESRVNQVIASNTGIETFSVDETEAAGMQLRRAPKVTGSIRLVKIGEHDIVACGGMHTATSSEVRLAFWTGSEKIRGHVRLYWKIGDRAFRDYREKSLITDTMTNLYSVPLAGIIAQVTDRLEQQRLARLEISDLENRLAVTRLRQLAARPCGDKEVTIITGDLSSESPGFLKLAVKNLDEAAGGNDALFCGIQKQGQAGLIWAVAATRDDLIDFNIVRKELFPIIEAKGGGKPPVWQGKGDKAERGEEFLRAFTGLFS